MSLHYYTAAIFCALRNDGILGPGITRSLLEIGEQNWYGDMNPATQLRTLTQQYIPHPEARAAIEARLDESLRAQRPEMHHDIARMFYAILLGDLERHVAIDLHGTARALSCDLNNPLPIQDQFDLVFNGGTAEHIFNIHQLFKTIHERTAPGGLMLHDLPNQGWPDHGFYNFHPTFCFDLAEANGYHLVCMIYYPGVKAAPEPWTLLPDRASYVRLAVEGKLAPQSNLMPVFRKPNLESPFRTPSQGYYANRLPPDLMQAWLHVR